MEETDVSALNLIKQQLSGENFSAGELRWFWFCASLSSYKRDCLLRPFPAAFRRSSDESKIETKDFERLSAVASTMPALKSLILDDDARLRQQLSTDQINLLEWVFRSGDYELQCVDKSVFDDIKRSTGQAVTVPEPSYVFKVKYDDVSESRFVSNVSSRRTKLAYHGSQVAHFYSILRHGLLNSFNKTSAFGEGTYLSSELSVSLNWSPSFKLNCDETSKPKSTRFHDRRICCVLVCEILDDLPAEGSSPRASSSHSGSSIPEKYSIIANDELIRIRYVLTYVDESVGETLPANRSLIRSFCSRNRFWLFMLMYFLLLVAVGLVNSRSFQWYVRRFWINTVGEDDDYSMNSYYGGYDEA